MTDSMTSKERITAALQGRPVDYVPFSPFLAYVWEHFPQDVKEAGQLAFHHRIGADPMWRGAACPVKLVFPPEVQDHCEDRPDRTVFTRSTPVGEIRWVGQNSAEGNTSFLVEHPLKTADDFRTQMWIEEHCSFEVYEKAVRDHFAGVGAEGLSVGMLIPRMKTAFQSMVEFFVGTEELVYALADFPETVEQLLAVMVERDNQAARMAMDTGHYEYWLTFEDSSTQNYSPSQYDRYISSEISHWCDMLAERNMKYVQHACGHVKALLNRMLDDGVTVVESLSPPPTGNISLADARQTVGDRLGIIGGIEPTAFLNLPDDQFGGYVEQVLADGAGGPFVLANSDSCPPGVSIERFATVAGITRRVGA